ncbi:MAG: hypothetical protein IT424_10050 [Pirellulales bacterium]|nr:hypothetical protein [Pirellulales bacterium]
MTRRWWMGCVAWSVGWLAALGLLRRSRADQQQADLNETLRSVLKCRRSVEFAYVDLVTAKVDSGELPLPLVLSMMKWAAERSRKELLARRRKSDIPFPYFQEGLRLRAAAIGVELPAFNPLLEP